MVRLIVILGALLICSCSASKQRIMSCLEEVSTSKVIIVQDRYDINRETFYTDSTYVHFRDKRFLDFDGFGGIYQYESIDGQTEYYGNGDTHHIRTAQFYIYLKYFQVLHDLSKFKRKVKVSYVSPKKDSIIVTPRIKLDKTATVTYTLVLNDSNQLTRIIKRDKSDLYYVNDSIVYHIKRPTSEIQQSYFFNKLEGRDSINVKKIVEKISLDTGKLAFDNFDSISKQIHISGPIAQNGKSVVIYSFISCAPCAVLKQKLKEEIEQGNLDSGRVVVMNAYDDEISLKKFIATKQYNFSYYKLKSFKMGHSFPTVAFYNNNGRLEYEVSGYSPALVRNVLKYLKD